MTFMRVCVDFAFISVGVQHQFHEGLHGLACISKEHHDNH